MKIFIDTEFTSMLEPELLSLGMVADDGREFYAELDLTTDIGRARRAASSAFVAEGILELWGVIPHASCSYAEIGLRAGAWLLQLASGHDVLQIAFDYSMDYELLEYAIRDSDTDGGAASDSALWSRVRQVVRPLNVNQITSANDGQIAAERCYAALKTRGLSRHHALADALALRAAWGTTAGCQIVGS